MSALLEMLYGEFRDLKSKLNLVTGIKYGGTIPPDEEPIELRGADIMSMAQSAIYSVAVFATEGRWKEKIVSALEFNDKPMIIPEISTFIHNQQRLHKMDSNEGHVHGMVTQIASRMGRAGEIGVDDSSFRNKYFIHAKDDLKNKSRTRCLLNDWLSDCWCNVNTLPLEGGVSVQFRAVITNTYKQRR